MELRHFTKSKILEVLYKTYLVSVCTPLVDRRVRALPETDGFQSTGIKQCLPAWFRFIKKPCGKQAYTSTACIFKFNRELMADTVLQEDR